MSDQATPRVNGSMLPKYVKQTVVLMAKVEKVLPDHVLVQASDDVQVKVLPAPGTDYSASPYVEIIGRVTEQNELQEFKCTMAGEKFNLQHYGQLLNLAHAKYSHLFGY